MPQRRFVFVALLLLVHFKELMFFRSAILRLQLKKLPLGKACIPWHSFRGEIMIRHTWKRIISESSGRSICISTKTKQIWQRFRKLAQDIQTSRAMVCLARVLWEMGSKELHIGLMKSQSIQQNQLFITIRHSGRVKWQKGFWGFCGMRERPRKTRFGTPDTMLSTSSRNGQSHVFFVLIFRIFNVIMRA